MAQPNWTFDIFLVVNTSWPFNPNLDPFEARGFPFWRGTDSALFGNDSSASFVRSSKTCDQARLSRRQRVQKQQAPYGALELSGVERSPCPGIVARRAAIRINQMVSLAVGVGPLLLVVLTIVPTLCFAGGTYAHSDQRQKDWFHLKYGVDAEFGLPIGHQPSAAFECNKKKFLHIMIRLIPCVVTKAPEMESNEAESKRHPLSWFTEN